MHFPSLIAAGAALTLCASLTAQSPLQTFDPFLANNAGSVGGNAFFDLIAANSDIEVTAFDVNCNTVSTTDEIKLIVSIAAGTSHVGLEQNRAAWTTIGYGVGVSAGIDNPTNVQLSHPICIPAGTSCAVALTMISPGFGHAYTNGTGANQVYTNNDLTFSGGSGQNTAFVSTPFSPRIANVNIYYNTGLPGSCTQTSGPNLVAVAEPIGPPSFVMETANGSFIGGVEQVRWNFFDAFGTNTGKFSVVGMSLSTAPAATPLLPGLEIAWAGSSPAGVFGQFGPSTVGSGDQIVPIPLNVFALNTGFRIQGVILDPAAALGPLPAYATVDSLVFLDATPATCTIEEGFEAQGAGVGSYPIGWGDGGGAFQWSTDGGGGTPSGGTGPNGGFLGSTQYMFCETSGGGTVGATYILNSDIYPVAGLSIMEIAVSRVGANIGQLDILMGDGTGTFPTTLATLTGPAAGEWNLESFDISGAAGPNVQFQFLYTNGPATSGSSFQGDLALDSLCMR